jgi:hypothetical protein
VILPASKKNAAAPSGFCVRVRGVSRGAPGGRRRGVLQPGEPLAAPLRGERAPRRPLPASVGGALLAGDPPPSGVGRFGSVGFVGLGCRERGPAPQQWSRSRGLVLRARDGAGRRGVPGADLRDDPPLRGRPGGAPDRLLLLRLRGARGGEARRRRRALSGQGHALGFVLSLLATLALEGLVLVIALRQLGAL